MLESVLSGRTPGQVYLESEKDPQAALVRTSLGFTFIGGSPQVAWLEATISGIAKQGPVSVVIPPVSDLPDLLPEPPATLDRLEFRDPASMDEALALPSGTRLEPIDSSLLRSCTWDEIVRLIVGDLIAYPEADLGIALMRGTRILSEAYDVYLGRDAYEIGTVTHPDEQGKGYSTLVCKALIQRCQAQGKSVIWSCDAGNPPSVAVARKLGFGEEREYRMFLYGPG